MNKRLQYIKKLTMLALSVSLYIISGLFIKINIPPVPFSTLTLFCTLSAMLLGKCLAPLSVIIYVVMGLCGLPIFAKGMGGPAYVFEPSFGYLLGFIISGFVVGLLSEKIDNKNFKTAKKFSNQNSQNDISASNKNLQNKTITSKWNLQTDKSREQNVETTIKNNDKNLQNNITASEQNLQKDINASEQNRAKNLFLRVKNSPITKRFLIALIGLLIVYAVGVSYFCLMQTFYFGNGVDFSKVLVSFVIIFIPSDVMWCLLASVVAGRIKRALRLGVSN